MLCPECRFDVRPVSTNEQNPFQEAKALSIHLERDHGVKRSVEELMEIRETLNALRDTLPVAEVLTVDVEKVNRPLMPDHQVIIGDPTSQRARILPPVHIPAPPSPSWHTTGLPIRYTPATTGSSPPPRTWSDARSATTGKRWSVNFSASMH